MKGFKILKRIGAERDWTQNGIEGICSTCGLDFYDEEKAIWAGGMIHDLDQGISGFALAHARCKVCERKE